MFDIGSFFFFFNPKIPNLYMFDGPWIFKSLQNLGSFTYKISISSTLFQNPLIHGLVLIRCWTNQSQIKLNLTPEEQAEVEQIAFASTLAAGKEATVIEFCSPKCRLCNSLVWFCFRGGGYKLRLAEHCHGKCGKWNDLIYKDIQILWLVLAWSLYTVI